MDEHEHKIQSLSSPTFVHKASAGLNLCQGCSANIGAGASQLQVHSGWLKTLGNKCCIKKPVVKRSGFFSGAFATTHYAILATCPRKTVANRPGLQKSDADRGNLHALSKWLTKTRRQLDVAQIGDLRNQQVELFTSRHEIECSQVLKNQITEDPLLSLSLGSACSTAKVEAWMPFMLPSIASAQERRAALLVSTSRLH